MTSWLFASGSARRLGIVRIAVGAYALGWLLVVSPELVALGRLDDARFDPVAIVAITGLGPHSSAVIVGCIVATALAGVAFTAGRGYRVAAPLFAAGLLWLTSYQNSWSKLLHTENLLVVHVLVLAVVPAADALTLGRTQPERAPDSRYGWPIRAMALATVCSYVTAGVTKLRHAGLAWFDPENLRNWLAYDLVRKELFGDPYLHIVTPVLRHPWLLLPAVVLTALIELGAPVALLNRRLATMWTVAAWAFHVGVLASMSVLFPYHLVGVAYLPLLLSPAAHRAHHEVTPARSSTRSIAGHETGRFRYRH